MTEQQPCKGFWNMCQCETCRARNRALETELENASPAERQKLLEESITSLKAARGIR